VLLNSRSCSSRYFGRNRYRANATQSEFGGASVEVQGKLLFEEVCKRNLEGMVCKRKASIYAEHGWIKVKNPHYTQAEGRHEMFTAFRERPGRKSRDLKR
jgi:ATP-dependent DNA ligase